MKRPSARLLAVATLCAALCGPSWSADAATNSPVREVVVAFKTHFDIGYTDTVTNVLTKYRTKFVDSALGLIEASRTRPATERFVWTVPGWPLQQMFWPGQTPERREAVDRALADGQLALHALPFTTHTESADLEELVRGLTFSAKLTRERGLLLPRAAKMTDVPEHTWILPTLLKHAGINFLHLGCNGGSAPPQVPPLFWWEGPDGSRVLTSYAVRYGTGLMPPEDWPYRTWLALIMTGDNHGAPTPDSVDKLLQQAARELPGVKVKFGKLEDFYAAIAAEKNPNIPVVRGDMPDTWIHGLGSMPEETKLAWDVRPLEIAAGVLDTELRAAGLNPPPLVSALAKAYENSLLYSEHTFGFDSGKNRGWLYGDEWKKARAEGHYARFESSFDDKRNTIRTTANIVTNALDERLALLARNVDAAGSRIVVFNPLPWKRSGEVAVLAPGGWNEVQDLATGKRGKASLDGANLRFFASDIPAGGYKTFRLAAEVSAKASVSGSSATVENKFFRLAVDPVRGCIASLTDRKTGRELVATRDPEGFGGYLHERFSLDDTKAFMEAYCRNPAAKWISKDFGKPSMPGADVSPHARIKLTNWTVSIQADATAKTIMLRSANAAPLARAVTLKYTLYEAQPYLDVEWAVEDKTPDPIPEGGWLSFPLAIDRPAFKLARLGSVMDPAKDIVAGANRRMFCLNSGLTLTGPDGFGVGLCPLDSPLVSLDEPGLWQYSLDFTPKRARVFFNLYNNQWDTNFPLWQEGSWTSRVRLWVVRGRGDTEKQLLTPSWEARLPLLGVFADGPGGKLPAKANGVELSRRGVLVTSFGGDPYTDKTLLRLWEMAGKSGRLTVKLPAGLGVTSALPVNLRGEREGKPIGIHGGSFKFYLSAFAPASFSCSLPRRRSIAKFVPDSKP